MLKKAFSQLLSFSFHTFFLSDRDHVAAVSSSPPALQSGLAAVTRGRAQRDAKSSVPKPVKTKRGRRQQKGWGSDGGDRESPDSHKGRNQSSEWKFEDERRKRRSQSLPRDILKGQSKEKMELQIVKEEKWKKKNEKRRENRPGRSEETVRWESSESSESEGAVEMDESQNTQNIHNQRLPEPKLQWEEEDQWEWDREWKSEREQPRHNSESDREEDWERENERKVKNELRDWELNGKTEGGIPNKKNEDRVESSRRSRPFSGVLVLPPAVQPRPLRPSKSLFGLSCEGKPEFNQIPFDFLTCAPSDYADSESGASVSDGSVSAASISGLSAYFNETLNTKFSQRNPGPPLPGPWLKPTSHRHIREDKRMQIVGRRRGAET